MKDDDFITKLHLRELSHDKSHSRKLYSDRRLVESLDIVNELQGHTGCVNALSWSRSGRLLASGSDDQHLNIHQYLPTDSSQQFALTTTVATGHTQNIFSVKFMPHSNDQTVITSAGDGEVRVFDLNYSGASGQSSRASALATESRRRVRARAQSYLTDGNTNARVYRSHGDRVKRIVTESSPYLFLTCSEDGEVRQWDLRLPSSAYPSARGYRYGQDSAVPPPLISYKKYSLDLNSISCSASQPHYIALGGAHLHALLHDRRMAGRDKLKERGAHLRPISQMSAEEQEIMSQATQCVKKFAPKGQKRTKRSDDGHITALKISDARPDEMIVSWSGDHVYSFDLMRDPGSEEEQMSPVEKSRNSSERKRKRAAAGSETSLAHEAAATTARQRTQHPVDSENNTSLRIRYQNGQSEDIPLSRATPLTQKQRRAQQIARSVLRIKSSLLDRAADAGSFVGAMTQSASVLAEIDDIIREWMYPLDPDPDTVLAEQTLRHDRERTRRFVQAAGTLARVLGGGGQTGALLTRFALIESRQSDLPPMQQERFGYDFIKAILLWLESGIGRLIEGFTKPADMRQTNRAASRLPIPEAEASSEAVDEFLVPYLVRLAGDQPIANVESNQFETDSSRQLFDSEQAAVVAFAATVRTPFQDLSCVAESSDTSEAQDRQTAHQFWARQVARGVLLNMARDLTSTTIDHAFGGLGRFDAETVAEESRLDMLHADAGQDADELALEGVEVVDSDGRVTDQATAEVIIYDGGSGESDEYELELIEGSDDELDSHVDQTEDDEESQSDSSSEADEEDGVPNLGMPRYIYRSAFERRRLKSRVEPDVPTAGPTRSYHGHCNLRTVKDVNYFGLDDEYVVSGSDDGNLFIWDRKTTKLVNILEGDGEVVNVVQGHPYETMLAVSGIDQTIKIFSPDARSREVARLGQGVSAADDTPSWPVRVGRRTARRHPFDENGITTSEPAMDSADPADIDDYVAPTGLNSRRRMHDAARIVQQNNDEIEGSNHDSNITLPHSQLLQLLFGLSSDRTLSAVLQDR